MKTALLCASVVVFAVLAATVFFRYDFKVSKIESSSGSSLEVVFKCDRLFGQCERVFPPAK